jgi:hypothetical protein
LVNNSKFDIGKMVKNVVFKGGIRCNEREGRREKRYITWIELAKIKISEGVREVV